jgi:hypothetical protein
VYELALIAGAALGSQAPSCAVFPTILIVSPGCVTTRSLNVTLTAVGHAVPAAVEVRIVVGVAPVAAVVDSKTTGFPFAAVTQTCPFPSAEMTVLLPLNTSVHLPFAFCVLKQCCALELPPALVVRTMRFPPARDHAYAVDATYTCTWSFPPSPPAAFLAEVSFLMAWYMFVFGV